MSTQLRRAPIGVFYEPLDELLDMPVVRILRALQRLDWIGTQDLADMLGVLHDDRLANAYAQHVVRLAREGNLDRRTSGVAASGRFEYRINDRGRQLLVETCARAEPERELGGRGEDDPSWLAALRRRAWVIEYQRGRRQRSA